MSESRIRPRELARQLLESSIVMTESAEVTDPVKFLHAHTGSAEDAVVVAEETDRVVAVSLSEFRLSERTLHLHAFSAGTRSQARAARTASGWVADAVHECDATRDGARRVLAQQGRAMCLGERISGTNTFAEARIRPYGLPAPGDASQLDVLFWNYFEETASGRLACIAHRVIGFVAREVK